MNSGASEILNEDAKKIGRRLAGYVGVGVVSLCAGIWLGSEDASNETEFTEPARQGIEVSVEDKEWRLGDKDILHESAVLMWNLQKTQVTGHALSVAYDLNKIDNGDDFGGLTRLKPEVEVITSEGIHRFDGFEVISCSDDKLIFVDGLIRSMEANSGVNSGQIPVAESFVDYSEDAAQICLDDKVSEEEISIVNTLFDLQD